MGVHDGSEPGPEKKSRVDFEELASAMDEMREALRGMVAGLVADGFSDREAHAIVAKVMGYPPDEKSEA